MAKFFQLLEHMEKASFLSDQLSMVQALEQARSTGSGILTIVDSQTRPQGLVRDEYLTIIQKEKKGLGLTKTHKIQTILKRLPGLITIDAEVESLEGPELITYERLFHETQAPGLIVLKQNKPIGTISRGVIVQRIPDNMILLRGSPMRWGSGGGGGLMASPFCSFICNQCDPPSHRQPRDCDKAPMCPREPDHGQMQPV